MKMKEEYTDEEIQAMFIDEAQAFNELVKTNAKAAAYAQLFASIDKIADPFAPEGLSEKIVAKVEQKEARKEKKIQISFVFGLSIILLVLGSVIPFLLSQFNFGPSISVEYLVLGFGLGILGLLFEWLDHHYIQHRL